MNFPNLPVMLGMVVVVSCEWPTCVCVLMVLYDFYMLIYFVGFYWYHGIFVPCSMSKYSDGSDIFVLYPIPL